MNADIQPATKSPIIEAKEGTRGYQLVATAVGQVGPYTTQPSTDRTAMRVRCAVLWTSTGDINADVVLESACEDAAVIPLPWGRLNIYIAASNRAMGRNAMVVA